MAIRHNPQRWRRWWATGAAAVPLALIAGIWQFRSVPVDHGAVDRVQGTTPLVIEAQLPLLEAPPRPPLAANTVAATAKAVSIKQVSRLDFVSAEDLYAVASAAANSNDLMALHNGRHALISCATGFRPDLESLATAGRSDAVTEERRRAATLVLRRCAGFFNNDGAANASLRRRLRDGLLAHEGEYISGTIQGGPSDKQIAAAIERGDWETFSGALGVILPRALAHAGITPDSEDDLMFGVGFLQAPCDLGRDCSPNGLGYALHCAMVAEMCAGSWEALLARGVTEAQLVKVRQFQAAIVGAYRRKDMAYFGLRP